MHPSLSAEKKSLFMKRWPTLRLIVWDNLKIPVIEMGYVRKLIQRMEESKIVTLATIEDEF
jgi:hypothetical protein